MATIVTNEWTSVSDGYPIAGRVVLVVVERVLKSGNVEFHHGTAIWNGADWISESTATKIEMEEGERIACWYMFERYFKKYED